MAGAVVNAEHKTVASISISIPVVRISDEVWERMHRWIERACQELSGKLFQ